jgi:hypothetical protein
MRTARDAGHEAACDSWSAACSTICQAFPTCSDDLREQGHSLRAAKLLDVLCGDRRSMYFPPPSTNGSHVLPSCRLHQRTDTRPWDEGQGTYLAASATNSCNTIATGCVASLASTISGLFVHVARRTGATLGDAKLTTSMLDAGAATGSAQ